jgi:hypothetical protein
LGYFDDSILLPLETTSLETTLEQLNKVNPKNTIPAVIDLYSIDLCDAGDRQTQPVFNVLTFDNQTILTDCLQSVSNFIICVS